eukprot:c6729_g1_i1.p1 GENE.c6729_g1_i1~~c6729_g1_i1.p1  ORF type:complete len:412 (-),score=73.37 c6729_g1_i1:113-1348(-)
MWRVCMFAVFTCYAIAAPLEPEPLTLSVPKPVPELTTTTTAARSSAFIPLTIAPRSPKHKLAAMLSLGTIPLQNFDQTQYLGNIFVGTPPTRFGVILDTGSANTWVYGSTCSSNGAGCSKQACINHNKYFPSDTYKNDGTGVEITYGSGRVSGKMFSDRLSIEECSGNEKCKAVNNFLMIGVSCVESGDPKWDIFADSPFDGVMGLGLSALSAQGTRPLIDILKANGMVNSRKFSFYLKEDATGSRFFVGEVEDLNRYIQQPLQYHPVMLGSKHWSIAMSGLKVGDHDLDVNCGSIGCPVVPDTGTSLITGPTKWINQLSARIGVIASDCSNLHSLPNIYFVIGTEQYRMRPEDYVYREENSCVKGYYGMDMPSGMGPNSENMFILGDSFLRRHYAEFDVDNNRIGLAPSK